MTLCIAAVAKDRQILIVTDGMLSVGDYFSVDTRTVKVTPVSGRGRWWSAFAGCPSYAEAFALQAAPLVDATDYSLKAVARACEEAFQAVRQRAIETQVLSTYKMSIEAFVDRGQKKFGDAKFADLAEKMEAVKLKTDFIVRGHDPRGKAHIFSVTDPGEATSHQAPGFHAVGTGSWTALGSLYSTREPISDMSWVELAYRVLEAKYLGESASGVGRNTNGILLKPDGSQPQVIQKTPCDQIRDKWLELGRPSMPDEVGYGIQQAFKLAPWKWPPQ